MAEKNLVIITKIIFFYSLFYAGLKIFVIIKAAWLLPNLILAATFLILALASGIILKKKAFSWIFTGLGTALIIFTRIYEHEFAVWMHQQLN